MSKYLVASSDWHLSRKCPVSRIDGKLYFLHGIAKVEHLVDIANKYKAPLIVAGDIWDTLDVTPLMINTLSDVLRGCEHGVFSVAGQHDQDHRLLIRTCPYLTLARTGAISHLDRRNTMGLFGLSYGDTKPLPTTADPTALVVHRTITKGKPPFFLKDGVSAAFMLNQYKDFRIIISGDYHVPFTYRANGQLLVNCGCLMRKDRSQVDYIPRGFVINCDTLAVKAIPLNIKRKQEVFNLATIDSTDAVDGNVFDMNLDKVIAQLQNEHIRPSFRNIALTMARNADLSDSEMDLMQSILKAGE
jgi:DNA repair exonuclease SbcCD nuclease subunit